MFNPWYFAVNPEYFFSNTTPVIHAGMNVTEFRAVVGYLAAERITEPPTVNSVNACRQI